MFADSAADAVIAIGAGEFAQLSPDLLHIDLAIDTWRILCECGVVSPQSLLSHTL